MPNCQPYTVLPSRVSHFQEPTRSPATVLNTNNRNRVPITEGNYNFTTKASIIITSNAKQGQLIKRNCMNNEAVGMEYQLQ